MSCLLIGMNEPSLGFLLMYIIVPFPLVWIITYMYGALSKKMKWKDDDSCSINPAYWGFFFVISGLSGFLSVFGNYGASAYQD